MLKNAIEGMRWGLIVACLLSGWAIIMSIVTGSAHISGRNGTSLHVAAIVGLYLLGGVTTGALMGTCRRLLRWQAGAVLLGVIAAIPVGAALYASMNGLGLWNRNTTISLVIFSVAFGGGGGLIIRQFAAEQQH